jgi:hypothetical protein
MANLEQELRGFDKAKFESFVQQYLWAQYPGAGIKQVDGAGGDGGIDSFKGTLSSGPAIWQSKHFPDRIKKAQKKQIIESIKAAFKNNAPSLWTLCVPINLRTDEHRWFQDEIVAAYGGDERIKLIHASDLLTEVQHNRPLRDMFFPESAQSEMLKVREALTKTEGLAHEQLNTVAVEYAQQYLESDMSLEPRLQAVIAIGGSPLQRQPPPIPGLVMSITKGQQSTFYFARDQAAFNLDPITFDMKMSPEGHAAFQDALDRGRGLSLAAGNITEMTASSPLLQSLLGNADIGSSRMEITPQVPAELANKTIPMRLTAGSGQSAQILPYVPFRITRPGRREIELTSVGPVPAVFTLVFQISGEGSSNFNISPRFLNSDARQAYRLLQFLEELERSSEFEVHSVEFDVPIVKQSGSKVSSHLSIAPGFRDVASKAAAVSEAFNIPLQLQSDCTDAEYLDLELLSKLETGEPLPNFEFQAVLIKRAESEKEVLARLEHPSFLVKLEHPGGWRKFRIFGTEIDAGPVRLIGDQCSFVDPKKVRDQYICAQEGEHIPIRMRCAGLSKFERIAAEDLIEPASTNTGQTTEESEPPPTT